MSRALVGPVWSFTRPSGITELAMKRVVARTIPAILGMILICVYKGRRDKKGRDAPGGGCDLKISGPEKRRGVLGVQWPTTMMMRIA
jgi:hypothetical protein